MAKSQSFLTRDRARQQPPVNEIAIVGETKAALRVEGAPLVFSGQL